MNRRLRKQILYGLFYLACWTILFTIIYYAFVRPAPSCTNNRKDTGEEGVDCGGVCANVCLPPDLRQIEAVGSPNIFYPAPGHVSILAKIQNPNTNLAAKSFEYEFDVYAGDKLFKSIKGLSYIYKGEIKYLTAFLLVQNEKSITKAVLTLSDPQWEDPQRFSRPALSIQDKRIDSTSNVIQVSGLVKNSDTLDFPRVTITAVFKGASNAPVGVSETEIDGLTATESRPFNIIHPLLPNADLLKTELFVLSPRS